MSDRQRSQTAAKSVRPALALYKRDDFDELKVLGEGFFSRVLLVHHKQTNKFYVLKLPKAQQPENGREQLELARVSLLHECQILQRLSHPHVISLIGQCVDGESPNIIIEYANRGTLEQLLADRHVLLDTATRVRLAYQIADGLAYLHASGVLHRDLSSENILVRDAALDRSGSKNQNPARYSAVIADLGLAMLRRSCAQRRASLDNDAELHRMSMRHRNETLTVANGDASSGAMLTITVPATDASLESEPETENVAERTRSNSTGSLSSDSRSDGEKDLLARSEYGSVWWKAPEHIVGDDMPYTERADVYSLGILLAELATRLSAVPDPGLIPRHDRRRGFALDFDKFREHPQMPCDLPPQVLELIRLCCRLEPARRPAARFVQAELREALHTLGSADTPLDILPEPPSLYSCASEAALRKSVHRRTTMTRSAVAQHSVQFEDYGLRRNKEREKEFYRAVRTATGHNKAFRQRRRSVSLSSLATDG